MPTRTRVSRKLAHVRGRVALRIDRDGDDLHVVGLRPEALARSGERVDDDLADVGALRVDERDHHGLALVVRERDLLAVVVAQREVGRLARRVEHQRRLPGDLVRRGRRGDRLSCCCCRCRSRRSRRRRARGAARMQRAGGSHLHLRRTSPRALTAGTTVYSIPCEWLPHCPRSAISTAHRARARRAARGDRERAAAGQRAPRAGADRGGDGRVAHARARGAAPARARGPRELVPRRGAVVHGSRPPTCASCTSCASCSSRSRPSATRARHGRRAARAEPARGLDRRLRGPAVRGQPRLPPRALRTVRQRHDHAHADRHLDAARRVPALRLPGEAGRRGRAHGGRARRHRRAFAAGDADRVRRARSRPHHGRRRRRARAPAGEPRETEERTESCAGSAASSFPQRPDRPQPGRHVPGHAPSRLRLDRLRALRRARRRRADPAPALSSARPARRWTRSRARCASAA